MAIQVTAPERIAFSLNPIVWKFETDGEGISGGSTSQNLIVFTGAVPEGTLLPVRWNGNQQQLRAVASPHDYGGEFPAGDGSTAYVASLVSWFQNNYYFNEDFVVAPTTYQSHPALQFQSREAGKAYDFSPSNFAGGSTLNDVSGVNSAQPVNASVMVEVWVKKGVALGYTRVYRSPLALDGLNAATLDVSSILHAELRPDMPSMLLPTGGFVHDSRLDYYIKYAPAGGENFSVGQLTQSDEYTALLGGTSYESGSDATVENRLLGLSQEQDKFLNLLGPTRYVFRDQPAFLSFINLREDTRAAATLLVTVHYSDNTSAEIELAGVVNLHPYQKANWGVGYNQLALAHATKIVSHYTARLVDETDAPISEEIMFVVRYEHRPYLRYFAYTNSLGAPETLCIYGKGSPEVRFFREQAEQVLPYAYAREDGQYLEWDHWIQEGFEAASGWIAEREYLAFRDMFRSVKKFRIVGGETYPINIQTTSIKEGKDGSNTHAVAFSYQYAYQNKAVSEGDLEKEHSTNPLTPPPGLLAAGNVLLPGLGVPNTGIVDAFPTISSPNLVSSGGVYEALTYKQDKLTLGNTAQYLRGDGSLGTFATAVAALESDPTVPVYAKSLTSKQKILSDITTIDGTGSGLDADLWRGQAPQQMTVWKSLQWAAAITLSLTGAVTGNASIDGSGNVTMATTLTTPGLSGTANRLAKFSPAGNNVIDSAIKEVGSLVTIDGSVQVFDGLNARYYGKSGATGNPIAGMLIGNGYGGSQILDIGGGTVQAEPVSSIRFRLGTPGSLGPGNIVGTWNATGLGINAPNPTHIFQVGGDIRVGVVKIETLPGEAPLITTSTAKVNNLHADLLDGWHGSYYQDAANLNAGTFPIQRHPLSGVAGGSYTRVDVNSYGHITAGSNPTTLAGYGITDAVNINAGYVDPAWLISISASKVTGLPSYPTIAGTTNYVARFTAPSTLGIGTLYDNGTSVGIGTSVPQATLHVLGDMWVRNADSSYLSFASTLATGARIDFNNTQSLHFWFNGTSRIMSMFDNGRVGINTNTPTHIFQVGGDIRVGVVKIDTTPSEAPIITTSIIEVANFNAQRHGGYLASQLARLAEGAIISGSWTFNTLAPTSTVANTTANNFELATVGWVKSYTTEGTGGGGATDPTPSWVNAITAANITSWNTASSWGNHNAAGYQTVAGMGAYQPAHPLLSNISGLGNGLWCRVAGSNAVSGRTIEGSISINVDNGSGYSGNPVISITPVHGGFTVNNITVRNTGQVLGITPNTYANSILPLLPASVLHDSRPPQFSAIPPLSATVGQFYTFTLNLAPYKTSYHNASNMNIKTVAIGPKSQWLVKNFSGMSVTLSGTPNTSGAMDITITVADNNGNETTVPIDGTVLEPGTEVPVTITAKLFNVAAGTSVDLVSGGSYPYNAQWQLRFYVVGTHNQVAQGLTGVGPDASWGLSDAKPGGITTQESNHGVFIGSAEGSGRGPGTYTFTPKAYLAGVVKAQPQFIFTLVEDTGGGGGGENFTGAYAEFYTGGGSLLEDQIADSSFTAAAPWKAKWRIMNKDFDKLVMGVSYSATQEGAFAPLYERTLTGITPSLALQRFDVFATGLSSAMPSDGSGYYLLTLKYFKSGAQFDSTVANFHYTKTGGVAVGNMVIEGNSMLHSGYSPTQPQWNARISATSESPPSTGWGMAATAANQDYAHKIAANFGLTAGQWKRGNGGLHLEQNFAGTINTSFYDTARDFLPDTLIIRVGENATAVDANNVTLWKDKVKQMVNYIVNGRSGVRVIISGVFWNTGNAVHVDAGLQQAANELGATFAELKSLGHTNYRATEFTDQGIADHPNDAGMSAIAGRINTAIEMGGGGGGELFTRSRMGFTNPGGNPVDGVALIQQNKTLGFNSLGTSFAYDFQVDADLLDINWPEYNHVTNSSPASSGSPHTFDALVHQAYLDDQELRVMIGLNQLWRDINGRNGITAYYGPEAMHMRPDGSPTCADNYPGTPGDPNDPPYAVPLTSCVSLSHPAVYPLALKKCRLFVKRYKPAIQANIIPLFGIGFDPNAEAQGLFEMRDAFGNVVGQPKGDFNDYAVAEFKARYPQHEGADKNAIANASYSTALGNDWHYYECNKMPRFEWRLIADLVAEFPWLADKKFWMIDAGSHADALSHIRRTFGIHSRIHPIYGGFVKANDNPHKYYLFDYLWSAGADGIITYEEITPMDGAINATSKSLMVEYATRCRKLGIGLSWLTQGVALNGIFQEIAQEAGLYGITTRQSPDPADVRICNLNLSDIIAGGTSYLENQWTAAGGSATKFVKFIVNNDKALPGDDEPPDGGGYAPNPNRAVTVPFINWPGFADITVVASGNGHKITDTSTYNPPAGYELIYFLNNEKLRGAQLVNYQYDSLAPLLIHKQVIKIGLPDLIFWGNGGWQDSTGGAFVDEQANLGGQTEIYFT